MNLEFKRQAIVITLTDQEMREIATGLKDKLILDGISANDDRQLILEIERIKPHGPPTKKEKAVELLTGESSRQEDQREGSTSVGGVVVQKRGRSWERDVDRSKDDFQQGHFGRS